MRELSLSRSSHQAMNIDEDITLPLRCHQGGDINKYKGSSR
jgi:hypothetical protein